MPLVRVSREVHAAIEARSTTGRCNREDAVFHPDGSVDIPLSENTIERLQALHPDIEVALRDLLGIKDN